MDALGIITFVLVGIILVVMFSRRIYAWMEARTSREYTRQVKAMWRKNWNGNEEDRIPAWQRTIYSLETFDYPFEMAIEAMCMMQIEVRNKIRKSGSIDDIENYSFFPAPSEKKDSAVKSGNRKIKVTEVKS